MNIQLRQYPYDKDCTLAVTLDDLHPEGIENSDTLDFGHNLKGDFWTRIDHLAKTIPLIKVTIFTVADWLDRSDFPSGIFQPLRRVHRKRRSYIPGTFRLDSPKYKKWVYALNSKIQKGTIEIALHGLTHHNNNPAFSSSTEFLGISKQATNQKIINMVDIFKKSGLRFAAGFRAPGWGVTKGLVDDLEQNKMTYTANSAGLYVSLQGNTLSKVGLKNQKLYEPNFIGKGLVNFTANCYPYQYQRAVEIAKRNGIIIVHAHIAKTIFGLKYVDKNFVNNVKKIINEISNQTMQHVWFASLSEIAEFLLAKEKTTHTKIDSEKISFTNRSSFDLKGLTIYVNNEPFVIDLIRAKSTRILDISKYKNERTKVSIILTVYNGEQNVIESLESLVHQTYHNIEIIVVNDGSRDKTRTVLQKYVKQSSDQRISILNQTNQGRARARNNGFKKSSGDIVTFCEDDAKYDKDYIKNAVEIFTREKGKLGGVIGPHYVWNKNASINTRAKDVERRRNFIGYKPSSCWFYRREDFIKAGMFDETLEMVDDVVPAYVLKKKGYHFVFAENCRWLHKEPVNFRMYLRRKFRGGMGLALLQKTGWKKQIVPFKYWLALVGILTIAVACILWEPLLFLLLLPVMMIALAVMRSGDIRKVRSHTNETLPFLVLEVYIEYIWWSATFLGYLYGLTLSVHSIDTYLKGR